MSLWLTASASAGSSFSVGMSERDQRIARSCRLVKKAHLLRSRALALAAAYLQYASLGLWRVALYLDLFDQPGK
jgi:hypothetical protein